MTNDRSGSEPFFMTEAARAGLDAGRFDAETAAFLTALESDGGALVDLGPEALLLCDQAVSQTEPYFEDGRFNRVQDAWCRSPAVRALANLPKVRALLRAAYGREPFAFQTLNFRQGSQQHFHSDTIHFDSLPHGFMCGVWIALEDVQEGAGPLVYKLRSHKLPVLTMQDVGARSARPAYEDYVANYVPEFDERLATANLPTSTLLIKKGQAFVWTANLAHGGRAIDVPGSTRRSLVVHFYFEGCTYFTPMTSNPVEGQLTLRLPSDLRTGGWVWPRRNGRRIDLPLRVVAGAAKTRLLAKPAQF